MRRAPSSASCVVPQRITPTGSARRASASSDFAPSSNACLVSGVAIIARAASLASVNSAGTNAVRSSNAVSLG
jgi:hypothetical protein